MSTGALARGGNPGYVPFTLFDGWTIFLTSANGAKDFDRSVVRFDVQKREYYGGEYDVDRQTANRLMALAAEIEKCRSRRVPVVIHCNHGRTRSVICVGVYLMLYHNADVQHALGALRAAFVAADDPHFKTIGDRVERALTAFGNFIG
jgi:hypothetical protein